jgi:pyridoxal phosphate enzyme (YggS family)
MGKACLISDRAVGDLMLTAVSKQQPEDRIEQALQVGLRVFGENRVQEAQERWQNRRALYPGLELRLIGPLQTNKAAEAVALFDVIESLDRPRLAQALAKACQAQSRWPTCLVQVNTGEEPQKAGIAPQDALGFIAQCQNEFSLKVTGLMCIPPADEPAGPHFALLAKLARQAGLAHLSMGMSEDLDVAIRFGATHVRVGSALFGSRPV